ncbi:hypothetical protein AB0J68_01475 [Micromonospora sp. NPDC049580]|uniref:hypothetical protein n=1 Tax=Micromonospora sp. NPDC049580 TaxID=3154832 RepID=UPI0034381F28
MSLVGDRTEIGIALSTVEGVRGYAYRPTVLAAGDGWPMLGPLERAGGLSFTATWRVFLVLPQDEQAASEWLDTHHEDLVDALEPTGFVDRIEPVELSTEAGPLLAIQITMRSE